MNSLVTKACTEDSPLRFDSLLYVVYLWQTKQISGASIWYTFTQRLETNNPEQMLRDYC